MIVSPPIITMSIKSASHVFPLLVQCSLYWSFDPTTVYTLVAVAISFPNPTPPMCPYHFGNCTFWKHLAPVRKQAYEGTRSLIKFPHAKTVLSDHSDSQNCAHCLCDNATTINCAGDHSSQVLEGAKMKHPDRDLSRCPY